MKTCPTCQKTYPDDFSHCPRDCATLTLQATESDAQLASGLSSRYRILRRLGQGGMGTAFLAEQVGVGNRPVALKVLNRKFLDDPDFLQRFQNEAGSTGRIHHPNVVTIFESAQGDDGTPYIAMEFLEGESLREVLKRRGAARLQQRIQELKANLAKQANPTGSGVVELLRANTKEAFHALEETQSTFHKLASPESPAGAAEVFFGDLRKSYDDVLLDLEPERTRSPLGGSLGRPFLMLTAWAPIPQTRYPVLAQVVFRAFEQNELAYNIVSDTGTLFFDLDVGSSPMGATVSYRRRGDPYRQLPNPTNTVIKALTYAIWQVQFQKQGYRVEEREHDPFREPNHTVHVELQR